MAKRYYFHSRSDDIVTDDEEGLVFDTIDEVRAEAEACLEDLGREVIATNRDVTLISVIVRDSFGYLFSVSKKMR